MDAKALEQDRLGLAGHDRTRVLTGALRWLLWERQTVEVRVGSHSGAHRRPPVAVVGRTDPGGEIGSQGWARGIALVQMANIEAGPGAGRKVGRSRQSWGRF